MRIEHADYSYEDNEASCTHEYLLPALLGMVGEISRGKSLRIVDLGCGNGYVSSKLAGQGHSVVGVDVSRKGIEIARESFPEVAYILSSIYDDVLVGEIGGKVDCVVALEVVEHLFYPKKLFEQSYRLLSNGGSLVVSTPYHGYLKNLAISLTNGWDRHFGVDWDGGHIKFFSQKTLGLMAINAGFKKLRFTFAGRLPGFWKSMMLVAEKQE